MHWTDITNALLQVAAALILAVGTWAVGQIVQWLGLKNQAQVTATLDDALNKSVIYGLQQAQDQIRAKGWDHADVRNQTLATSGQYLIDRFPDVLRAAGFDMGNPQALSERVTGALDRAFPHAAATAAASPSTPPATAPNPQTTQQLPREGAVLQQVATATA